MSEDKEQQIPQKEQDHTTEDQSQSHEADSQEVPSQEPVQTEDSPQSPQEEPQEGFFSRNLTIIIIMIVILLLLVGGGVAYAMFSEETISSDPIDTIDDISLDDPSQYTDNNFQQKDHETVSDGIDQKYQGLDEKDKIIEKNDTNVDNETKKVDDEDPTDDTSDDDTEEDADDEDDEGTPEADLDGPSKKENADDMEYTYSIVLNKASSKVYTEVKFDIDAKTCDIDAALIGSTSFAGKISDPETGDNEFTIKINENYLQSKTELEESTYMLKDQNGTTIDSGDIQVPQCEEMDNGTFSMTGPDVDKDLVDGKYHFEYDFDFDDTARDILEKGFTHKVKHDCDEWIDGDDAFESTWDAGEMNKIGFAENIDEDAFDEDDYTEGSTYEILDVDDDVIFTGSVDVPKCKDK